MTLLELTSTGSLSSLIDKVNKSDWKNTGAQYYLEGVYDQRMPLDDTAMRSLVNIEKNNPYLIYDFQLAIGSHNSMNRQLLASLNEFCRIGLVRKNEGSGAYALSSKYQEAIFIAECILMEHYENG